jgi:preprotein translocase subunit SecF
VICTYSAIFVSTPVLIYLGLMLSGVKAQGRPAGGRVPQAAE